MAGTYDRLMQISHRTGAEQAALVTARKQPCETERDVWRDALRIYERNKPLLLGAEDSLPAYGVLAKECAALAERGVLAMNLAQAVYATLDTLRATERPL